uniref:Uncharacterized protein n=1 Tax=Arundo donax TaxID=35708 RepID=A0A0A8YCS4_ARUDO
MYVANKLNHYMIPPYQTSVCITESLSVSTLSYPICLSF